MRLSCRFLPALVLPVLGLCLSGCDTQPERDGPDMGYLTSSLDEKEGSTPDTRSLLPLDTGNSWKFLSVTEGKRANDESLVTGPVTVAGQSGINIEIRRNGVKWRREVYSANAKNSVSLIAMQDETSDLMVLDPPVPIVKYPPKPGQSLAWRGTFTLKNQALPAHAVSRVSAMETIRSQAGRFETVRVDTIIVVNKNGTEIQFPSVRWLAPGVGLVRRGFAERGRPAFSELTQFSLK